MTDDTRPYPRRPQYFAHRYCRLLTKCCAAMEIGPTAALLCMTIAMLEDSKRYTGPVTFYNEQLMPLIGVATWDALHRARDLALQHGWLVYQPGNRGKRRPGRYWVAIPADVDTLNDSACDESQYPETGNGSEPIPDPIPENGEREGGREGEREGEPSTLSLPLARARATESSQGRKTKTRRKTAGGGAPRRFKPPTVDEVRWYVTEQGCQVDPAMFVDFYQAKGWRVGREPMRDWRAAVRNWARRSASDAGRNGHAPRDHGPLITGRPETQPI